MPWIMLLPALLLGVAVTAVPGQAQTEKEEKNYRVGPDAKIGPAAEFPQTLLGSHVSRRTLEILRGDRVPDDLPPDIEPPDEPPPELISAPDLAFQIKDFRSNRPCPPEEDLDELKQEVAEGLSNDYPNADVRLSCARVADDVPFVISVGVWTSPTAVADEARNRGLAALDLLGRQELFGFMINSALIRREANGSWDGQQKRINHDGDPDPDGSIHLTGFSLSLVAPDKVVTKVMGFDDSTWPDTDFTLIMTDTLVVGGDSHPSCETKRNLTAGSRRHFLLAALTRPLPVLSELFLLQGFLAELQDAPEDLPETPGCNVARTMPLQIMLAKQDPNDPDDEAQKLVFFYDRVDVNSGGIFAVGVYLPVERDPQVSLVGPRRLSVDFDANVVSPGYTIITDDLRGELNFDWTPQPVRSDDRFVGFSFDVSELAVGASQPRVISVAVTDEDNLEADALIGLEIFKTSVLDDTIPTRCRAKPWLPGCSPR